MRTADDIHDEWLVLRCQDGDAAALAELVDRWQPRLLRQAFRLTRQTDGAADVVQAAWVAIISGLRRLDDPACFRRWVYQIVTYKCADWVRTRQRERERSKESVLALDRVDRHVTVDSQQDDIAVLREALDQLEPQRKAMLSMFYVDDMSLKEIAEALTLPVGTVKSRLHYARLALKDILERSNP